MAETAIVEIWEFEEFDRNKNWVSDSQHPWTSTNFEPCKPPDEYPLPGPEWCWSSNWKIEKKTGTTDENGWEYASNFNRFKTVERSPKFEKKWKDRSRRRVWSRAMRKDADANRSRSQSADMSKALPRIQQGLSSIHKARLRIEQIMKEAPDAAGSEQMQAAVTAVRKNIMDILTALDQVETHNLKNPGPASQSAVIKKLKNDLAKEEMAIEKALDPTIDRNLRKAPAALAKETSRRGPGNSLVPGDRTLRKASSFYGESSSSSSGVASTATPTGATSRSNNPFAAENSTDIPGGFNSSSSSNPRGNHRADTDDSRGKAVDPPLSMPAVKKVTGGNAKAFDPAAIASASSAKAKALKTDDDWTTPEDGVFVDRTMQERLIEQQLKPVDEATVMQEIIDERTQEIKKIYRGISEVNEMFKDLSEIVKQQQVEIDKIFENADVANAKTKDAVKHIMRAEELQRTGNCVVS